MTATVSSELLGAGAPVNAAKVRKDLSLLGSFIDLPPKVVDVYLQATVQGFEYPRSDLPRSIRFVGPILAPPSTAFDPPGWWNELGGGRPVVHVTQGTLDNADLSRMLGPTMEALAGDDVLVVAGTIPEGERSMP